MISILKTNRRIRLGGNEVRNAHCSNLRTGYKIRRNIVLSKIHFEVGIDLLIFENFPLKTNKTDLCLQRVLGPGAPRVH